MNNGDLKKNLGVLVKISKQQKKISVAEIMQILSGKSRLLILIFLSLPFCQPIQIPGFSTPFGLVIAFIGFRMAFGKKAWLPKFLMEKTFPSSTIQKISQKLFKIMSKLSRFIHPRLKWLSDPKPMRIINSLLIAVLGIFLALPLPIPVSNLIAGWAIFLTSLGLMEKDGIFILMGYLITLAIVVFFILLTFEFKQMF